jgi:hypothetical protein
MHNPIHHIKPTTHQLSRFGLVFTGFKQINYRMLKQVGMSLIARGPVRLNGFDFPFGSNDSGKLAPDVGLVLHGIQMSPFTHGSMVINLAKLACL